MYKFMVTVWEFFCLKQKMKEKKIKLIKKQKQT